METDVLASTSRQSTSLAVPGMPVSERQQMAMIREMINREAATPTKSQTPGKLYHLVIVILDHFHFVVKQRKRPLHIPTIHR